MVLGVVTLLAMLRNNSQIKIIENSKDIVWNWSPSVLKTYVWVKIFFRNDSKEKDGPCDHNKIERAKLFLLSGGALIDEVRAAGGIKVR